MIAWKIVSNFNKQKHLFYNKIEIDYIIETYICSCGHTDFIIKYSQQELKYICPKCENIKFNDANDALVNIDNYMNDDYMSCYEYDSQVNNKEIRTSYILKIPKDIEFANRKIIFVNKLLYTLRLTIYGKIIADEILIKKRDILSRLTTKLTQYIKNNNSLNVSYFLNMNIDKTIIFSDQSNLEAFDYNFWNTSNELRLRNINIDGALERITNFPKEKSVRKAYYKHYIRQLCDNKCFYSSVLEAFCNNIKDINILVKLLDINFSHTFYKSVKKDVLNLFLKFLTIHYSDKQILKLFTSDILNKDLLLLKDTLSEFSYDNAVIENNFKKVSCKLLDLHDEFVRCLKEERYKYLEDKKLKYSKEKIEPCIEINSYQVKLPHNGEELFEWAEILHNCMAGYFDMIENNETIIYGFFQNNILAFAIEMSDNKIIEFSGKYNADLTIKENQVLSKWLEQFFPNAEEFYNAEFKTKLVIETLEEKNTIKKVAGKYGIAPDSLSKWKDIFLTS